MSNNLAGLYQELILEHSRNPRNFGTLPVPPAQESLGINPSCGDKLVLYLERNGNNIVNIKYDNEGCAIFKASCSLMSQMLVGKTIEEAKKILGVYMDTLMLSNNVPDNESIKLLGKLKIFENVKNYPVRVKCAALFARTMQSMLDNENTVVSSEDIS